MFVSVAMILFLEFVICDCDEDRDNCEATEATDASTFACEGDGVCICTRLETL